MNTPAPTDTMNTQHVDSLIHLMLSTMSDKELYWFAHKLHAYRQMWHNEGAAQRADFRVMDESAERYIELFEARIDAPEIAKSNGNEQWKLMNWFTAARLRWLSHWLVKSSPAYWDG